MLIVSNVSLLLIASLPTPTPQPQPRPCNAIQSALSRQQPGNWCPDCTGTRNIFPFCLIEHYKETFMSLCSFVVSGRAVGKTVELPGPVLEVADGWG